MVTYDDHHEENCVRSVTTMREQCPAQPPTETSAENTRNSEGFEIWVLPAHICECLGKLRVLLCLLGDCDPFGIGGEPLNKFSFSQLLSIIFLEVA